MKSTVCLALIWTGAISAAELWRERYQEGLKLLESGMYPEAEQMFQSTLALHPQSAEAYNGLGLVAIQAGESRSAAAYFDQASKLQPSDSRILYHLLSAYLASAQPVAALQCADRLLSLANVDPDLYRQAGERLSGHGHVTHAMQLFRAAQRSKPQSTAFQQLLAEADAQIQKDAENVRHIKQALETKPGEPGPYFQLGLMWIKLGQFPRSYELMKTATEKFPGSAEVRLAYALACYFTGQNKAAEQAYRRVIRMQPNSDQPYFALGNFYADTGRFEDAAVFFRRAAAKNPKNYLNYYMLGVMQARRQEYSAAEASLSAALGLNPKHADSNFWLGKVCLIQERRDRALEAFERAVRLEPKHIGAYYQLILLYARMGEKEKSREALEMHRQLNAQLHKGLVALRMP